MANVNTRFNNHDGTYYWDNTNSGNKVLPSPAFFSFHQPKTPTDEAKFSCSYMRASIGGTNTYVKATTLKYDGVTHDIEKPGKFLRWDSEEDDDKTVFIRREDGTTWHKDNDGNITKRFADGSYIYTDQSGVQTALDSNGN